MSGACSSCSGRQGAVPDRLWEAPLTCRGRGAPECGGAQMWRRRPRPVRPDLGGPKRPPCLGTPARGRCRATGTDTSEPRPGTWRHTQPKPGPEAVGVGAAAAARDSGPEFLSSGSRGPSAGSDMTHTCPAGGWLRGQAPFLSSLVPALLEAARAVLGSPLWASVFSSVTGGQGPCSAALLWTFTCRRGSRAVTQTVPQTVLAHLPHQTGSSPSASVLRKRPHGAPTPSHSWLWPSGWK